MSRATLPVVEGNAALAETGLFAVNDPTITRYTYDAGGRVLAVDTPEPACTGGGEPEVEYTYATLGGGMSGAVRVRRRPAEATRW